MDPIPSQKILSYEPRPTWDGKAVTLSQLDGQTIITFPAPRAWMVWTAFGTQLLAGTAQLVSSVMLMWMMHQLGATLRMAVTFPGLRQYATIALFSLPYLLLAAHTLRRYFRWGLVSRTLTLTPQTITIRWLGWMRMREKIRRTSDLKELKLSIERDLLMRRRIARIYVRFRTGFPRSIIIPAESPQAADQMLQALKTAVASP
jgi:hypothetical protein